MNKFISSISIWLLVGLLFLAIPAWSQDVPSLSRRVTDETGTLSDGSVQSLESALSKFETETSNQIVVLIISSLNGGAIEDYSLRVSEQNKVGKKGRDNGVLLLIVKDDHLMRIEVGYGLEGALPDAISDQIIRRIIAPRFREGNFADGVRAGVEAIISATKGEFKGEQGKKRNQNIPYFFIVMGIFIFFSFISRLLRGSRSHYVGSRGYNSTGGWWIGGFGGGGGSSGGGFGGGGFSGGGGSFGGGGASGSW